MARVPFRPLNGLLLLDKSRDISSNRALQNTRFTYRAKKAGHTGTLDPFATGLLPLCFGEANKYARWLLGADKTYEFTAILGQHSTTGDTEGEITLVDSNPSISETQLRDAEITFTGEIEQIPPKFSAIKINGQRAYKLARQGEEVIIPSRHVVIHELKLTLNEGKLVGSARVSKGTYIRTLVEDLAIHLGTVAYCEELRRVQIANLFDADKRPLHTFASLQEIETEDELDKLLLPMDLLCQQFPVQIITPTHWDLLVLGRKMAIEGTQEGIVRLYLDGVFCGLGEIENGILKVFRLLHTGF